MRNIKLQTVCYHLSFFLLLGVAVNISAAVFTVNQPDDFGDGICDISCTLRDAVLEANTSPDDDTIDFLGSLTLITLNDEIVIDQSAGQLAILGFGANLLTIDGGPGSNRIFYTFASGTFVNQFDIFDVTLTGGNGGGAVAGGHGGAIYSNTGSIRLTRVYVTGNSASFGGGVAHNAAGLSIFDSTISNNTASNNCGGFYNNGDGFLLFNSTISGNTAAVDSGGFCNSGSGNVNFSTITNNTAFRGGGFSQVLSITQIENSIIAGNNHTGGGSPEIYRSNSPFSNVNSAGYNLIGVQAGDSADTNLPIAYQPSDILDTSPQLVVLGDYGGTTPTHALQFPSPARDAGDPLAIGTTDQRGLYRDIPPDIGAFEIQDDRLWYITQTTDTNGACDEHCSLREAVAAAPIGGILTFAGNYSQSTPIIVDSEIYIDKDLTISGPGADTVVITANGAGHRIFFANTLYLTISGITLTGGVSNFGGAIYVSGGNLTVDGVHFLENGAGGQGGGIYFQQFGFEHIIRNSTFSGNNGTSSGGGFACFSPNRTQFVAVVNSTFTLNRSTLSGGAFSNSGCVVSIRNVTVSNNSGGDNGGIALSNNGTLNIGNSIISGNVVTGNPPNPNTPEIFNFSGTITSAGNSIIGDSSGDAAATYRPIAYHPTDILDTPPLLGSLQMNGGQTPTLALLPGSPAINAGDNAKAVVPFNPSRLVTDQRGFLRFIGPAPPVIDIGAFEFGSGLNWSAPTFIGSNVNVVIGPVSVIFGDVSQMGDTLVSLIDPARAGTFPTGFTLAPGLPSFDITTTAAITPPITVCVQVPTVIDPVEFAALRLLHGENGVLIDRTIFNDFATKTVCASVPHLSPFVVAKSLAPTAASVTVSGRVLSADGRGIYKAVVSITDTKSGETRSAISNSFGYYRFDEISVGTAYILTALNKQYQFSPQIVTVVQEIANLDMTAEK